MVTQRGTFRPETTLRSSTNLDNFLFLPSHKCRLYPSKPQQTILLKAFLDLMVLIYTTLIVFSVVKTLNWSFRHVLVVRGDFALFLKMTPYFSKTLTPGLKSEYNTTKNIISKIHDVFLILYTLLSPTIHITHIRTDGNFSYQHK